MQMFMEDNFAMIPGYCEEVCTYIYTSLQTLTVKMIDEINNLTWELHIDEGWRWGRWWWGLGSSTDVRRKGPPEPNKLGLGKFGVVDGIGELVSWLRGWRLFQLFNATITERCWWLGIASWCGIGMLIGLGEERVWPKEQDLLIEGMVFCTW